MKRTSDFDKTKLISISSKYSVVDFYVDSFPIEKVKLRLATYGQSSDFIDIYIEFSDFLVLAHDIRTGKFFQDLTNNPQGKVITRGGSAKPGTQPESRILSASISQNGMFLNATLGPGRTNDTGLIMPNGEPTKKIGVPMSFDQCKKLFIYGEKAIEAYMPKIVVPMVDFAQQRFQNQYNS